MLGTPELSFSLSSAGWRNDVSYGDIVLFRFPGAVQLAATRPAARPCLVLDVETRNGRWCAVLVVVTAALVLVALVGEGSSTVDKRLVSADD